MPTVPVTVWEQIPVVVIFAFLLVGGAWLMVKAFSKAVADINQHYSQIIEKNNSQWQIYFDARSQTNTVINDQMIEKLEKLTNIIQKLVSDFEKHDAVEIGLLERLTAVSFSEKDKNI
jgi:predicted PurR-regulated permease PerM